MILHRQLPHAPNNTIAAKFGTDGLEANVQHQHEGTVRTGMNCHACHKDFLAEIDHSVDADLVLDCPHCGHKHYRQVRSGVVTEQRHGAGDDNEEFVQKVSTWKHPTVPAGTTTPSEFLRHRWLNLLDKPKGR